MPKPKQHQQKAEHNREFLRTITDDRFSDWKATAGFYVAVHLVEKLRDYDGEHSESHDERDRVVRKSYAAIYNAYHQLFNASIIARYKAVGAFKISPADVQNRQVDGYPVEIEEYVKKESAARVPPPPPKSE